MFSLWYSQSTLGYEPDVLLKEPGVPLGLIHGQDFPCAQKEITGRDWEGLKADDKEFHTPLWIKENKRKKMLSFNWKTKLAQILNFLSSSLCAQTVRTVCLYEVSSAVHCRLNLKANREILPFIEQTLWIQKWSRGTNGCETWGTHFWKWNKEHWNCDYSL